MNQFFNTFLGWFGRGGALADKSGKQSGTTSTTLIEGSVTLSTDGAMQLSTVWACVWLLANVIGSLPFFVYARTGGQRELAREEMLWSILHDSPNNRMTPVEFWVAMLLNLLLRGNAYARLERNAVGTVIAIWPMPADQVEVKVLEDGSVVYGYQVGSNIAVLSADSVLHIKDIGNGTIGMDRLDYMRATTTEAKHAQTVATKLFANGGKPSGLLMIDRVLKPEQREAIRRNFAQMAEGSTSRLVVLEADMKYQQVNLTPQDQQLLETRKFSVEEICRWFGVPPVLVGHSNVTAWGSGIEQLIDGFYKFTIRPMLVRIEQAVTKRVMTPAERSRLSVEFSFDALLRASLKDRMEIYAKAVQNGIKTRNECRQLENDPPIAGADELTAQTNLAPLNMLGKIKEQPASAESPITQSARLEEITTKAAADQAQQQRHAETIAIIKAIADKPNDPVHVDLANAIIHITREEKQEPPVVQVSNYVNPTPIEVNVTNDVNPTPVNVEATFEATVQPAEVTLNLPPRRTESTVTRNAKGEIIATTTVEKDA